jgi:hypothetical protein
VAKVTKKESRWRIAGAVVIGYAAIGLLIILTDWIFGFIVPAVRAGREMPTYYYPIVVVTDSIYSFLGGYLCAKLALTAHRYATIGLMIFGELLGLASTVALWYTVPHAYSITLMMLYPPMVWAGSWLRVRRVPVKPLMVRASA